MDYITFDRQKTLTELSQETFTNILLSQTIPKNKLWAA
jgi:hypothetical protein